MADKNIIHVVHDKMTEFYNQYKTGPKFIYLGETEYQKILLSQQIFCPPEHQAYVTKTELFGLEIVLIKRHSFLEVG